MATNSTYDAFIQHEEDLRKWHADREAKGLAHGREEEQAYLEWVRSQSSQIVPVPQQRTQAATTKFNAAISRTGVLPAARPGAPTSTGARQRAQSPKEMKVACQIVLNCAALSGYSMKRQMALLLGVEEPKDLRVDTISRCILPVTGLISVDSSMTVLDLATQVGNETGAYQRHKTKQKKKQKNRKQKKKQKKRRRSRRRSRRRFYMNDTSHPQV